MTSERKVWYRVEDRLYSTGWDDWAERSTGHVVRTNLLTYDVIRETPCGAWLRVDGFSTFVNRNWAKRFACPTVEEAIESFRRRKSRQIAICKARIHDAEAAVTYLDRFGFYYDGRNWNRVPLELPGGTS